MELFLSTMKLRSQNVSGTNPRCACAARVTVLGLCMCLCVCPSTEISYLALLHVKQEILATSVGHGQ